MLLYTMTHFHDAEPDDDDVYLMIRRLRLDWSLLCQLTDTTVKETRHVVQPEHIILMKRQSVCIAEKQQIPIL